jgi:hypothetical protein
MQDLLAGKNPPRNRSKAFHLHRQTHICCAGLLFLVAALPALSRAQMQQQVKPTGSEPTPEPAVAAILAIFDKYEVVAIPEAHGGKDVDDFILSLIRTPAFLEKVSDIAVECGNSLYQPILDRYIAGEDVPFAEVRKVWRNTTQPMCDMSGFFDQFFPLIRSINQKLPGGKRLRVLAGDPPIDWEQIKTGKDREKFVSQREDTIASVMEKEVLSKHHKALMLFGTFHLMHEVGFSAVSMYEKDFPGLTFVISDLGNFDTDQPTLFTSRFAAWPNPSLARAKGTLLGALDLSHFLPRQFTVDKDCNAHPIEFPKELQKPMEELVDAFLYLGPQDLRMREKTPADIALDADYITEYLRRGAITGFPGVPGTLTDFNHQMLNGADNALLVVPKTPVGPMQSCLDRKDRSSGLQ